jgi:hypothetical protein
MEVPPCTVPQVGPDFTHLACEMRVPIPFLPIIAITPVSTAQNSWAKMEKISLELDYVGPYPGICKLYDNSHVS